MPSNVSTNCAAPLALLVLVAVAVGLVIVIVVAIFALIASIFAAE